MAEYTLTCLSCGGALKFSDDGLHARCPYCGNEYHFRRPKDDALSLALNRADAMRRRCDFDGAITEYKLIIGEDGEDAEAHWGLVLSIYGIEFVEDTRTKRQIPTCRRTVRQSILENEHYLAAIKYADPEQAEIYKKQAAVIDRLQREIMRKMESEEAFDVFLCYRSADENGFPTRERIIARKIYDELTKRGIRTFFSEETLKDRLGDDYEPVIYKALYSCKFFVLIATNEKNINTPWVKNEWSRFRDRQAEEGLSGACCAVFEGTAFSDLPPFLRSAQGINLAKYPVGGYEIELADTLARRFGSEKEREKGFGTDFNSEKDYELQTYLNHAHTTLLNGRYDEALDDYNKICARYAGCGDAWWGAFLAKQRAISWEMAARNIDYAGALKLGADRYLHNAEQYADEALAEEIKRYKRACLSRCSDIAAQFTRHAEELEEKIQKNNEQLVDIASKKSLAAVQREKYSMYADNKKFKRFRNIMLAMWAFVIVFFVIIAFAVGGSQAGFGFGIMVCLCVLLLVIMLVILHVNKGKFAQKADELGRQVAGYYTQEKRIQEENETLQHEAEEERRKAGELDRIF